MSPEQLNVPAWAGFDADWYRANYASDLGDAFHGADAATLEAHYRETGAALGFSPNRFFDEHWYRATYPDINEAVRLGGFASGFDHYTQYGHEDRSPHWLFSEPGYLARYPDLTRTTLDRMGLVNGYDHYLKHGDREFRSGHPLFDPHLFYKNALLAPSPLAETQPHPATTIPETGPFATFLAWPEAGSTTRVSWYFDPNWYQETYGPARKAVRDGLFRNALHHFLTNPTPLQYCGLPWFSEEFYLSRSPDIGEAIHGGHFRSGYDHFVRFGCLELRQPHPDVNLQAYIHTGSVQSDIARGLIRDAFAHWVAHHGTNPAQPAPAADEILDEERLSGRRAEALIALTARHPLKFPRATLPRLSIVLHTRNRFPQTLATLAALRTVVDVPLELIIVDSGSRDDTIRLEHFVLGARIIRLQADTSRADVLAAALPYLMGDAVLWLGQGVRLEHGSVRAALRHLREPGRAAEHGAGAHHGDQIRLVTGRVLRPDGRLCEAGGMIWRDGTMSRYLAGESPSTAQACFTRTVACGTTPCLFIERALLTELGGFDPACESSAAALADLCLRATARGAVTLYEPALLATVDLPEEADDVLADSDRLVLRDQLAGRSHLYPPPSGALVATARFAPRGHGPGKRILFIEDQIPGRQMGSGFVRSNDIVHTLARLGHDVTVAPIYPSSALPTRLHAEFPDSVELLYDLAMAEFDRLIMDRAGFYDCIWIGRTHNLDRLMPLLMGRAAALPMDRIILDTEALAAPRTAEQAKVLGQEPSPLSLESAVARELDRAWLCRTIIAVNQTDASWIRRAGYPNVAELGHLCPPRPTAAPWSERRDFLFVGAIHNDTSPNADSLRWFVTEVLPVLRQLLPSDVRLTVAGYLGAGVDLNALGRHPGVELLGPVADLEPLYAAHRVFVAPTRFAGGIPYKVHEAASYGLPVMASTLLCQQLGWRNGVEILSGYTGDPTQFALQAALLYEDEALWTSVRGSALRALEKENSAAAYETQLGAILKTVFDTEPTRLNEDRRAPSE